MDEVVLLPTDGNALAALSDLHHMNGLANQIIMATMYGSKTMPNYIMNNSTNAITEFRHDKEVMDKIDNLNWRIRNLTFSDLNILNQNGIRYRFYTAPHTEKNCNVLYIEFESEADEIYAMILVS